MQLQAGQCESALRTALRNGINKFKIFGKYVLNYKIKSFLNIGNILYMQDFRSFVFFKLLKTDLRELVSINLTNL